MSIHDYIEARTSLAEAYARDGAFFTASNILLALAVELRTHAYMVAPDVPIAHVQDGFKIKQFQPRPDKANARFPLTATFTDVPKYPGDND